MNIKNSISFTKRKNNYKRTCYVKNPYPCYKSPKENIKKPAIIRALVNAAQNSDSARHEAWYTTPRIDIKTGLKRPFIKRMNLHRARAINALMVAMADRLNIVSNKVEASVEQLSDWSGLSTGNKTKKSISRASRALITLEELGALKCEKIWDNTSYSYIPKIIWVTELYFVLIDYELGKFLSAQNQQFIWENKKFKIKYEKTITLFETQTRAKEQHIKKAFNYRIKKMEFNKQCRQAYKITNMGYLKARQTIIKDLIKIYTKDELEAIGYKKLRRMVNYRYYSLKKLVSTISSNSK